MNRKNKWLYQNFTGLMSNPDEYQQYEIDKTLAKHSIIGLYVLIALVYLSIFFDIEREFFISVHYWRRIITYHFRL